MALDIINKDFSPGQIQISVWDETDNALRVKTIGGGGGGSVPVNTIEMYDDGNGTTFLREYIFDSAGAFNSYVDLDVDGNPYVLVGNAVPLAEVSTVSGPVETAFYDYTTPVTTSAYTQVIASTSANVKQLEIFDSSGQLLVVAFGAASSEVDQFYILPGGNGVIPVKIPAGTRVSIKAVSANASTGYLAINLSA